LFASVLSSEHVIHDAVLDGDADADRDAPDGDDRIGCNNVAEALITGWLDGPVLVLVLVLVWQNQLNQA